MKFFRTIFVLTFAMAAIFFVSNLLWGNTVLAAGMININTANLTGLEEIIGVGPAIAQKIIDYRTTNGPFSKIEDIVNVKGIGPATFSKMKDSITVLVENSIGGVVEDTVPPAATSSVIGDNTITNGEADSHYEQESLSNYEETASDFKVSAGRERVSYVGSPVSFEAKTKIAADSKNKKPDCTWSFGDGAVSTDEAVIHIYKYPGEYNVVLNASLGDVNSISRTTVKVLAPSLLLAENTDGSVGITNKGGGEINLFGWKLQSGNIAYAFPLDTIISAGKSVIFPSEYTKISDIGAEVVLVDASNKAIAQINAKPLAVSPEKEISLADLERFVSEFKKEPVQNFVNTIAPNPSLANEGKRVVATTSEEYWSDHYVKVTNEVLGTSSAKVEKVETEDDAEALGAASALAAPVVSSPGFWSKLFHPIRTIKESFYQ